MKFEVDIVVLGEVSRPVLMVSPLSTILRMLHTHLQLNVVLIIMMFIVHNDANSDCD
jgi:hypothetical protein